MPRRGAPGISRWDQVGPEHAPRAAVAGLAERLLTGGAFLMVGGRGMGKSHELRRLQGALSGRPDVRCVSVDAAQLAGGLDAGLAEALGHPDVELRGALARAVAETFVVLLIDEVDEALRGDRDRAQRAVNLLAAWLRNGGADRCAVLLACGVGVLLLDESPLGSSFTSRAERIVLPPLDDEGIAILAAAVTNDPGLLHELRLATGGIPALVKLTLAGMAADKLPPLEAALAVRETGFEDQVRRSMHGAPADVLRVIQHATDGRVPFEALERAAAPHGADAVVRLLSAAGLAAPGADLTRDPCSVRPQVSVLRVLTAPRPRATDLRASLLADLDDLLAEMQRAGADFYSGQGEDRRLVEEGTLRAFLALGLTLRGWRVEREAARFGGRTDLIVRDEGGGEGVVEVKVWPRNVDGVHGQVCGYLRADAFAGVVVTFVGGTRPVDVAADYQRRVLGGAGQAVDAAPLMAAWDLAGETQERGAATIRHVVAHLPRR